MLSILIFKGSSGEELNSCSWSGDVLHSDNPRHSICGLEISFSSVPQDINIKLIPTNIDTSVFIKGRLFPFYFRTSYCTLLFSESDTVDESNETNASPVRETELDMNKSRE